MKKYAKNIITPQPEESCPGHPGLIELLKPYIFMDKTLYPDSKVWVHMYEIPPLPKLKLETFRSEFHTHDADEIHMVYGKKDVATQRWVFKDKDGEETYEFGVPSSVYIPADVSHKNEWTMISDKVFVAVAILKGKRTLTDEH